MRPQAGEPPSAPRALLGEGQSLGSQGCGGSAFSHPAEILEAEKDVAQSLLDAKEQAQQGSAALQQIEAELQKAGEEDAQLKASLLYPFLRARNGWASAASGRREFIYATMFL